MTYRSVTVMLDGEYDEWQEEPDPVTMLEIVEKIREVAPNAEVISFLHTQKAFRIEGETTEPVTLFHIGIHSPSEAFREEIV